MTGGRTIWVDDADARRRLKLFETLLSDLRPFWPAVVTLQRGWWRSQFESEGRFAAAGWAPLSPAYAAWKARRYPGKPILQATGQMRRAFDNPQRSVSPHTLTLTVNDPKAAFHQDGTNNMPARPVAFGDPLPAVAALELQEAADRYVGEMWGRLGGSTSVAAASRIVSQAVEGLG